MREAPLALTVWPAGRAVNVHIAGVGVALQRHGHGEVSNNGRWSQSVAINKRATMAGRAECLAGSTTTFLATAGWSRIETSMNGAPFPCDPAPSMHTHCLKAAPDRCHVRCSLLPGCLHLP